MASRRWQAGGQTGGQPFCRQAAGEHTEKYTHSSTFLRPNSLTRASSGVMVAHLMPTWCFCGNRGEVAGAGVQSSSMRSNSELQAALVANLVQAWRMYCSSGSTNSTTTSTSHLASTSNSESAEKTKQFIHT